MKGWLDKYQEGGEVFLQPNSKKLPKGYKVPLKNESSELAMSIGGEQGEPAYLIPSFKYGKPLLNPLEEYRETGEHLGGPFKTWQEADKWEREIRHPYVEKGQPIPSPLKYWGEGFKNGGIVAQGGETISSSREIPEITVYGKKNYLQELDKQQQKYLADMAKYKQDSTEWVTLNNKYKNSKRAYEDSLRLYNWTELYKGADFNRPVFETLTNEEALNYIATTGDRKRDDVEKIGFLGTPFLNPKRGNNPNDYNNYYGGVGHTWGTKDIPSKYFEDITEENRKIIDLFKKQKIKPSHFVVTDNPNDNDTGSLYPIYNKPKGQSPIAPTPPAKPTGTNVEYDPTYENLQMRPLWATMAKQDTTAKIGTLNPLDPLYEKGFTYGEAQKFPEEIRKQYKLDYPIYESGGFIPKAQEGKKVKKSVIFAESPKIEGGQPQYEIYDYHSQLPPSLNNLREKYKDLRKRVDELYSTTESHRNYLINYLKGYTGKNVYSVNSDNTYYARDDDGYGSTYSTEEFKDLPPLKKYNELQKELDENYYPSLIALENEFRDHPDNFTTGDRVSDVFQVEGNKLREWYKKKGEELSVIPIYGIQDTSKVNAALKDVDLQDVGIMGHSGEILGGIPLEWWNNKLKDAEYRNCVLGSCYGDNLLPLLPDVKNIYHTIKNRWYGVNPSADSLENALFSTHEETKIKPIKGRDYNISNKYKTGGNVSYTPEYIEQLKQFENKPSNLGYHLDPKKIPTIGWGHRLTAEELKKKAVRVGKEWIPYEKFSGKEGRQYADRLMELDVAHHYNRLERQVGKDTLATLPPEVHDVLLDITYNRGSLGDSLEYVKSGDIAGLRDYLAETSKGLKGGAKTRMEWRANRIPVKTLPPVEAPINYNVENQYVPEVLQSIAEQPSTQGIFPIQDNEGYRNQENYGKPVQIVSNRPTTSISMDQVPFPILAMSDTGELKIMFPGEEHEFEGGSVTELPIAQEGASIRSDDRNWLQRFNDKVYSGYQEHKPQLFKDFPITDIVEPVVSYLTGHSDPDTGLMNILPGANLPNKYYRRLTEGQISKAIREKGLITPTLKEKGLTVTKSFPKKGQYVLELSTNKPVSANPLSISYGKTHPSQTYSFPDIVDLQSGNMKMFRRLNKKLIEVDPKLYGAPSKEALIDKQVIESMSPASGSLPYHHYAGEETLLSPHKIYKGGQNPPQLSLDRDYIYGIEKFKRNKSKINYADPSRSDEVSSPHIVNDYKCPSYVNLYDNYYYYASTEPSANSLTPLSKNIQKYIGTFSDEISPQFRSPQMINSVRSYYKNHFGEDVSMLSNEDISKFIQKSYNESGAKGVLYHSTNRPMTEYNPNYPTEERINPGWLGEGTYFADIPSQDYGLLQEPFIHSGIEKKVIINDIRDFKKPTVRFTSPQIEVDNLLKKISKPIVRKDKGGLSYEGNPTAFGVGKNREIWNKFIKDKQVDAIYSATSTKGVGMNWPEIIIPPSSSVNLRSLYPHPELIKSSLNKGRLNRDWSNPMINYEDGGNIKKSKQLRTFTEDNGWLNKYKELDESEPTLIDHQIPEVEVVADRLYPYKGCVEGTACDLSSHLKVGNEEFRKMNNFYGNAWNVLDNMYGNEINITNDYSGLNVGDVVNMSRKKFKSDIEKGIPESNQHIGRVSKIENGIPYIKHYISSDKKYYEEPINNISAFAKYNVTRAKRPDTLIDIDFNSSNLRFDENYEPNEIEQDILKVNKPELQRILRLSSENYDKLERIAYGIMGAESSFGRSKRSVYRMVLPDFVQKLIKVTHDMLRGKDVYDENINNLSQGYSSTKESSLHGVSDNTGELNYEEINKRVRDKDFTGLERTNNYLYQALQNMGLNTDNLESGSNSFKAVMATLAWLNKRFPNITEEELLKKYTGKKDISSYKEVYDSYLKNIDNNPNNNMDYSWFDEALGKTSHVANQLNNSAKKLNSMIVSKLRDSIPVPENASALFSDLLGAKEPITEKTLRKNTLDKLTNIVRNNIKKGKFTLEYNDYGTSSDKNSDVGAGKSPSISKMMNDEAYILKTLLGQATIKELGNNEYEIVDTYDFNDKGKSFGFIDDLKKRGYSPYAIVRSLGRNYGSQPNQGSQVRIKIKL